MEPLKTVLGPKKIMLPAGNPKTVAGYEKQAVFPVIHKKPAIIY
jgi:hypothetical protein